MNAQIQIVLGFFQKSEPISQQDKEIIKLALNKIEKELTMTQFKLDRTEKVKRTTSILLEETIEELEQKRRVIERSKAALEKSLEELKATQDQLVQREKMASLGELTAGIAHEIQNPLNFVNNFSEVSIELIDEMNQELEKGNSIEAKIISYDLEQNLEKINHHGKKADAIIKGMLLHSRSSNGQKELIDINALADEYLRLSYHGLRAKDKTFNADFKTDLDPNLPKIEVVPQDIGRVLLNLCNNAFQAVNEKAKLTKKDVLPVLHQDALAENAVEYKPLVILSTSLNEKYIEITVYDNGPGIPDDIKSKIFQPFFTSKPTGQGTGLGLSLAYDIVKAHGGEIKVKSEAGEGAEFTITLPISLIPETKSNSR